MVDALSYLAWFIRAAAPPSLIRPLRQPACVVRCIVPQGLYFGLQVIIASPSLYGQQTISERDVSCSHVM